MNYPAASSGVSKATTGKILRPKGRGIHPDGIKICILTSLTLTPKLTSEVYIVQSTSCAVKNIAFERELKKSW